MAAMLWKRVSAWMSLGSRPRKLPASSMVASSSSLLWYSLRMPRERGGGGGEVMYRAIVIAV